MRTVFTTKRPSNIALCLKIRGCYRTIRFAPPVYFGIAYESTYSTSDEDVITALKRHPDFNVSFFVKSEEVESSNAIIASKPKTIEDELKDPSTAVYDEAVTTKGMAVAYIQGNYDDVFTTTTVEEMKREAARKWNVIFKNWDK